MFENMWVRLEGFNDVVPAAWDKATKSSDPYTNLHNKLSFTAKQLKSWASSLLSDIQLRTRIVHELILQLDIARDSRMLTPEEHTFRGKLKMMSLGFAALDRCMLCQRS